MAEEFELVDKAAILLMSVGENHAAQILKHLEPAEVQLIGSKMTGLKNVMKEDVNAAIDTFLDEISKKTSIGVGADQYIQKMLVDALGEDKATGMMDNILTENKGAKALDTLKWMDANAIYDIIRTEHPQIQTLVLSCLSPEQSAKVLENFAEEERMDLVIRIATLKPIQSDAMSELNTILEGYFDGMKFSTATPLNGLDIAANILNSVEKDVEMDIIEKLKDADDELCSSIQELMFVFDNILDVDDRGIQALLRELTSDTLILALKGASPEISDKIFRNMSKRAADLLKDDLEAKGPVKLSQVEEAQKEIISIARRMADEGEISLGGKGEEMV